MNPEYIVIALLFIFSLILLFKNFKLGVTVLLILSVLLHKELFNMYVWNLMPVRIFMLAFLAFAGLQLVIWFLKTRNIPAVWENLKDPFILFLLLLWIIQGISIINSENLTSSISIFGFSTTVVALGIYLYKYLEHKPHEALNYIKQYIWVALGLCLIGIAQLVLFLKKGWLFGAIWDVPGHLPRIGSLFWDVNHFGGFLAALLPVIGALIIVSPKWKQRIFYAFTFAPLTFILLLTNSRTSWISAFVSFIVFIMVLLFKFFGKRGIVGLFVALVLISIPILIEYQNRQSPFRAEVKQYFHYRIDSFDSHFLLLNGTWEVFKDYPFIGGGYGSFFEHFSKTSVAATFYQRDPAALSVRVPAHTIWGELVSETGILGLTVFVLFILTGLLPLLYIALVHKEKKEYVVASAMFAALTGWLVAGVFYSYNSEFFWIIFFLYFIFGIRLLGKNPYKKVITHFTHVESLPLIVLIVLSFILVFLNLGKNHLLPWDEAIYAEIAKNMVLTKQYLVQNWVPGKIWYEKPPLYMWMMAFSMHWLGFSSFAARLPSALLGIGTIIVTYLFGKKLFNKTVGFISAFSLLTTFNFLYYARASMLDVTTTFFVTLSLYLYWLYKNENRKWAFIVSALGAGLAIMTKGVIGFLPFAIIVLFEIYQIISHAEKFSWIKVRNLFLYFVLSAVVFIPWHLVMYQKFGFSFLKNYIGYHVLDRATTAIEDKGRPFWWYVIVMKVSMRIWFVALIPALGLAGYMLYKKSAKHAFLIIWSLIIFFLFSISASKLKWYIVPVYPAVSIIIGYFLERALDFLFKKFKFLDPIMLKGFLIFVLTVGGLFYLFLNRTLVYESDLTGSQALLLQQKDKVFGTQNMVYVDRIELPLVLYYTGGPYEIGDFNPLMKKLDDAYPNGQVIFITKESRFTKIQQAFPTVQLIGQQKEWVLGVLPVQPVMQPVSTPVVTTNINRRVRK